MESECGLARGNGMGNAPETGKLDAFDKEGSVGRAEW